MYQALLLDEVFKQCAVRPSWGGGTKSYIVFKEVGNFSCFRYIMTFSFIFLSNGYLNSASVPHNIELPEFIYAETIFVTHTQIMRSSTHSYTRCIALLHTTAAFRRS
jgi:hypothetical protein